MGNIGNTEHALTFADLRVHYYTGRSYLISGEGRNKVFGYRHGVMTDIGDLPEAEWTRLAKRLIRQSGEQELYQQPEVLCNAEILWLKCSGCGKRHEMTGTQFKNIRDRSNGKLYCRKCGDRMPVHPCAHPKEGGDGNG